MARYMGVYHLGEPYSDLPDACRRLAGNSLEDLAEDAGEALTLPLLIPG